MTDLPRTFGDLDVHAYPAVSVRDELRRNLIARLKEGGDLFPGIVGYEQTVVPQVVNAILARHDIVFLGLRGQAKTRLARMIASLMDEWRPAIAGTPLREHPLAPVTPIGRSIVQQNGPDTPIEWIHRNDRYGEKLATPDVAVADLIGDIDPLKAAHRKLDLSDEEVINFGIIPRTNHGVFCINEVPDLAPRIQVALLNLLEEQDIQVRGFPLRIPMDVMMVFTANPEDYTNRGSIITPLKDRIASQITTHYPRTLKDAKAITGDQAWSDRGDDLPVIIIPDFMEDILEEVAFQGRESEFIDQKSGVSARLSIAARELLISQVERRLITDTAAPPVPRILDLYRIIPAILGKVELVYEGEQEGPGRVAEHLIGKSCQAVYDRLFPTAMPDEAQMDEDPPYQDALAWFSRGETLEVDDEDTHQEYAAKIHAIPDLKAVAEENLPDADEGIVTLAMELICEGLHQHGLLSKRNGDTGSRYGDMLRHMMEEAPR